MVFAGTLAYFILRRELGRVDQLDTKVDEQTKEISDRATWEHVDMIDRRVQQTEVRMASVPTGDDLKELRREMTASFERLQDAVLKLAQHLRMKNDTDFHRK
jgi:hypothetical protein